MQSQKQNPQRESKDSEYIFYSLNGAPYKVQMQEGIYNTPLAFIRDLNEHIYYQQEKQKQELRASQTLRDAASYYGIHQSTQTGIAEYWGKRSTQEDRVI